MLSPLQLDILNAVEELTTPELRNWINLVQPATGMWIDFRSYPVIDTEILDVLRDALVRRPPEVEPDLVHPYID